MQVEVITNVAYDDIYDDVDTVNVVDIIKDIPTKMALSLICHYTAQIHTKEDSLAFQIKSVRDWCSRFDIKTKQRITKVITDFNSKKDSKFNFINNVSSLLLIECLLENHNDLPVIEGLTPLQEENLFKAYIYFSAKWTKEQEAGAKKYSATSKANTALVMMLPYTEILDFKDFRLQFLKAVYFFKFCESNEHFKEYLEVFLKARGVKSWNEYLINLVSVYIFLLQKDSVKSVLIFDEKSKNVFQSLENLCIDINNFTASKDFLTIRPKPIYRYSDNELQFLNINFLIDKIYQGIIFDFADILIQNSVTFKGKPITKRQQFFGIFGDEFIETHLFYEVMKHVFSHKDYVHYTGDELKARFGEGTPDYLIIHKRKVYVFEFKNTIFNGNVKYSFDIKQIKQELDTKFVQNAAGNPKGVTQLVNFIADFAQGRYDEILPHEKTSYIIYPSLVTTDYTFNLPVIYSFILSRFKEILRNNPDIKSDLQIKPVTLIDFDSLLKFQDFFISKKWTLNHVLNDYQVFLGRGVDEIDKSLSFSKYLHVKAANIAYDSPKMFMEEIKNSLF